MRIVLLMKNVLGLIVMICFIPIAQADESVLAAVTALSRDQGIPAILQYDENEGGGDQSVESALNWQTSKDEIIRQLRQSLVTEKNKQQIQLQKQREVERKNLNAALNKVGTLEHELETQAKLILTFESQLQNNKLELNKLRQRNNIEVASFKEQKIQKDLLQEKLDATRQREKNIEQDLLKANSNLKKKNNTVESLMSELAVIKQETLFSKPEIKTTAEQQAYSVGTSLGRDAVQELMIRKKQGIFMDRALVLNGIIDSFSGKYRLDENKRKEALTTATKAVYKKMHDEELVELNKGQKYQKKFAERKGVKEIDGVYNLISYAGQEPLAQDDIVTVVVKESLIDGTVISDMELGGKEWKQKIRDYPPVFRDVLSRMGNHGSATIVVPADKAYGSKGRQPYIPAGSTMVYEIRVVDAQKS